MKTRRRIEITVETDQVLLISKPGRSAPAWCGECNRRVRMATAEQAALLAGVSVRQIYRWVEAGKLHFTETPEGLLLVCLNSLAQG